MTANGMSFYYGNYIHKTNEVVPLSVQQKYLRTHRGIRWAVQVELHIGGDFVPDDPSAEMSPEDVTARILALDEAYRNDYQDCGFLMDGQLTPHYMLNNDPYNLSGNQIIYRSWDNVLPTEYANTRSFKIIISATYLFDYSGVMYFSQKVTKNGDGGPTWVLRNTADGPKKVEVLPQSKVFHIQSGTVIGNIERLPPPPPLWPLEEHRDMRRVSYTSPVFLGDPSSRPGTQYRTDYTYIFERLGPDPIQGNDWYR